MGPPAQKPPLPNFEWATVPRRAPLRHQAHAGMQLAAGARRRHRFGARLVPAPPRSAQRSAACRPGRRIHPRDRRALRSDREQGRHGDRRAPAGDAGQSLLAHHPMGDAVPHHDPALRRQRAQRPRLRADRRRELHVMVLHAPSGAAALGARARGDAQRRRHPRQSHSRLVPPGGQQRQRLHDRPRGAEAPQVLFRRQRHRHAGRRDPGKHWADPGSQQGKPGLDRQRRDHGAATPDARRRAPSPKASEPDGIDPATHAVRSASIVLPEGASFYEAAGDALKAKHGVAHASV